MFAGLSEADCRAIECRSRELRDEAARQRPREADAAGRGKPTQSVAMGRGMLGALAWVKRPLRRARPIDGTDGAAVACADGAVV